MYRSCKSEERCGLDLKMLLRKFCYFLSLYLKYSSGFAVIKKFVQRVCVCVCVMGEGEESNDVSCIVPCGAISSYIKLQSAGYLLVITCYMGTAKAINNWIHVCIYMYICMSTEETFRRIQYVGVYLSVKRVSA